MKRLTEYTIPETGFTVVPEEKYKRILMDEKPSMEKVYNRLKKIEDILGDEYDLEQLNKALWCKKVVEDAFSDDTRAVERLRELWFADQKGHCVVFDEHYPVVSEYYRDEDGRYIREASGVISETEYMAAKGGALK